MRTLLLTTAALAALSTPVLAQEADTVSSLTVTATRLPALTDDQPGVTLITRRDLDQRQANTAYDALQTAPGLSIYRTGAYGGITTVRQRGASNDKSLVLIDGVPQNDASQPSGGFDFARLSLDEVSRIEVLNGPQGSLWGSDAIGGVIAFTTQPTDGVKLRLEGGSYGTQQGAISAGKVTDNWWGGVFASSIRSDGISAADKTGGNPEKDAYRNDVFGARGGGAISGVKLDGRVEYDRSKLQTDGYLFTPPFSLADTDDEARTKGWNGFGRARGEALGLDHSLTLGASTLDRAYSGVSGAYGYRAQNRVLRYSAQKGALTDPISFTFGLDRQESRADLSSGVREDLSANSAFVVGRLKLGERAVITASLRYDDPKAFKAKATGKLAASLDLGGGWRVLASAGQGFKTPSISQAVCDFCAPGPHPKLNPETAEGYDLGAAWASGSGGVRFSLTAYSLKVKDQIDFGPGYYVNLSRTESKGLEASASVKLTEAFSLKAAYSITDARDGSTDARLVRVPVQAGSIVLGYTQGPLSGALTLRGESSQRDYDIFFSPTRRKGFQVADLAAAYAVNETVAITARIENLTDAHYQEVTGYGEPGRSFYVGLRLRR